MKQDDFLKKIGIYARYLNQFLNEGDAPKVLETIKELEKIREQAEKEGIQAQR